MHDQAKQVIISAKTNQEAIEHSVKGLLAIDDFVKKNIDNFQLILC